MRRLGDVLELIHSSRRRFRTARVAGRTNDTAWRMWWAGDAYFRFERERDGGSYINVRAGAHWWSVDAAGEAHTNEGDPELGLGMEPEFGLLHTRSLLASALLEVLREDQVAGRPAVILRATPRPGADYWRWWGFWEPTDPIEVPIDLERGVALGGFRFRVKEIAFDEEFPGQVFSRPYPETVGRIHRTLERPQEVSFEDARRRVDFPLVLPTSLPPSARLVRCLVDSADPPEWLGLSWAIDPGYRSALHMRQGPGVEREASRIRGHEIVRQGARILVEELGDEPHRSHRVLLERRGAWVEVHSDLPLDTVIDIGLSVADES